MTTLHNILAQTCNVSGLNDVLDNVAFSIEIMFTLKAIKFNLKWSYDKQNLTLMVLSYEIMKLAKSLFHKFHMN